ncbi:MAG TPA: polyphosphate:AMP phosphotransferase [Gemmatimonadaceae bacterium]|nr:polyphosphate:AMP phosphotransferase [Gemmatimonadaceae bacterium]
MFEDAELGHSVSKEEYATRSAELRDALLDAQYALKDDAKFPVIVLIGGVEGGGRGETVNALTSWMDPRHIEVHGVGDPSDEERERPRLWRFWRILPPRGKIGIFFGSWYTWPIVNSVMEEKKPHWARLERRVIEINRFEEMLANEGALVLKFWFHLSKQAQRRRMKELRRDPLTSWRVTPKDEAYFKRYDRFREVSERVLRDTSRPHAPWIVVEGVDRRYRELAVADALLDAMRHRLASPSVQPATTALVDPSPDVDVRRTVLSRLDLRQALPVRRYERDLEKWQGKLALLTRHKRFSRHSVVVVFEGNDAAGKGGAIRRLAAAVDARVMRVVPVAAPTDEEKAHPYLWRFWRHLPRHGNFVVFDRSWYGRVLVERVEGFCSVWDWQRAYGEINDFEDEMAGHGIAVVKFWLAISKQEQLKRFKEREHVSFKHYKITPEDWRNRKKWDAYADAVCDMVTRTSTRRAPWTLVEANDKHFARIKVLKTVHDALERVLD